jgi:hypothetical protein
MNKGRNHARRLVVLLAALSAAVASVSVRAADPAGATAALTAMCGNPVPSTPEPPRHLIMIQMENESLGNIVGSAKAPYQTNLSRTCGMDTNMWAVSHPSLPNYVAENSGRNVLGTFQDCTPKYATKACVSSDDNLFHQMQVTGHTWRGYAEDMPRNCYGLDAGNYAARHNPAVYFTDLHSGAGGGAGSCFTNDVAMGSLATRTGPFYTDLAAGHLPTYSFIAPNLIDDAHSSSIQAGDAWLKKFIPLVTGSPNYRAGDTDIVIAYDEGAGSDKARGEDCSNRARDLAGTQPSCHIPFIVIAPYEKAGSRSTVFCTLYCFTRTVEALYHLPLLGHAGDAATRNLTADFNLSPA